MLKNLEDWRGEICTKIDNKGNIVEQRTRIYENMIIGTTCKKYEKIGKVQI